MKTTNKSLQRTVSDLKNKNKNKLTSRNVLLQLFLQESLHKPLTDFHVLVELNLPLLQGGAVCRGLVQQGLQRPVHLFFSG